MQTEQHCSRQQVNLFLAQQLSEEEQRIVELHLDGCMDCRQMIDLAAAPPEFWREAVQSLTRPENEILHSRGQTTGQSEEATLTSEGFTETECPRTGLNEYLRQILLPPENPHSLGQLAHYDIKEAVGVGGMSIVLKAIDNQLNRTVAVKLLSPLLAASDSARLRFSREARSAAAILHPCVTPVFSVSEWRGLPFLVMPFIEGETLQKYLSQNPRVTLRAMIMIGIQIADGLEAAHRSGIIHRDIKPANILLEGGILGIRITDFGLARTIGESNITQSGIIAGTPSYMSPEQARGVQLDHRSDLFSFGSVLYALATGQPPFSAETPLGVLRKIIKEEPRPVREFRPDLPEWFSTLIHRLLQKEAEDRFSTAGQVSSLLNQCQQHLLPGSEVPVPRELLSPHKASFVRHAAAFGTVMIAVALIAGLLIKHQQDPLWPRAHLLPRVEWQ